MYKDHVGKGGVKSLSGGPQLKSDSSTSSDVTLKKKKTTHKKTQQTPKQTKKKNKQISRLVKL